VCSPLTHARRRRWQRKGWQARLSLGWLRAPVSPVLCRKLVLLIRVLAYVEGLAWMGNPSSEWPHPGRVLVIMRLFLHVRYLSYFYGAFCIARGIAKAEDVSDEKNLNAVSEAAQVGRAADGDPRVRGCGQPTRVGRGKQRHSRADCANHCHVGDMKHRGKHLHVTCIRYRVLLVHTRCKNRPRRYSITPEWSIEQTTTRCREQSPTKAYILLCLG